MAEIDSLPSSSLLPCSRYFSDRPSELDAIAGGIVRAGESFDLVCPAICGIMRRSKDKSNEFWSKPVHFVGGYFYLKCLGKEEINFWYRYQQHLISLSHGSVLDARKKLFVY